MLPYRSLICLFLLAHHFINAYVLPILIVSFASQPLVVGLPASLDIAIYDLIAKCVWVERLGNRLQSELLSILFVVDELCL